MTVQIINNSTDYTIYPVLFAGAPSATDTWIQACFGILHSEIDSFPYPRATQYRMYINCCAAGENGIAPGQTVTITMPLYSPLVPSIDPTKSGQLIDWWQGGGINFYESKGAKLPGVLKAHWVNDQAKNLVTPLNYEPTCDVCNLHFFKAPNSIPNSEPQQLTEHTLGAQPLNPDRAKQGQPERLWVPYNVDYDVSYVNYVYMPAAMEPFDNPLIGYIGSPSDITPFNMAIDNWYGSDLGKGWPLYNGPSGHTKIPSALEIFLNTSAFNNTSVFTPAPVRSKPIMSMMSLWKRCTKEKGTDPICPAIVEVTNLLKANYDHYKYVGDKDPKTWAQWGCKGKPQGNSDQQLLAHLYGWAPYLGTCTNPAGNQLYDTPGYTDPKKTPNYEEVKSHFDELQYREDGAFDPYVVLIHGSDYINAKYTYAYSVDDALGNMQTDGKGLIIAVGGTGGLPNPDHATPNVNFPFGYSSDYTKLGGDVIFFKKYGRCTATPDTPVNPNFTSFPVPEGILGKKSFITNCTISMQDSKGRLYLFKLKDHTQPEKFPTNPNPKPADRQVANSKFIDCSKNKDQHVLGWCKAIYPYQQKPTGRGPVNYYVTIGGPPPTK